MIITIDESGSFVESLEPGSWNVVAAYVFPERIQTTAWSVLARLKRSSGFSETQEIKLNDVSEKHYFEFLSALSKIDGCLFVSATDAGLNTNTEVIASRNEQAEQIRTNIPRMIYQSGKESVAELANNLQALSPQLYVQMQCQVRLIHDVIFRGLLYYVQRDPVTLRRFKWRIDQKTSPKDNFETTFKLITPGFLQSISAREPIPFLEEADYSFLKPYEYGEGEVPAYINELYGHEIKSGINIGKILRENWDFPDSRNDQGVQIADLLASGMRRCLRDQFSNNQLAAILLGRLMISNKLDEPPLQFLGFGNGDKRVGGHIAQYVQHMKRHCRSLLL